MIFLVRFVSTRMLLYSRPVLRSRGRLSGRTKSVEFDSQVRTLRKGEVGLRRLSPQQSKVLNLLVTHAPNVVSSASISKTVWEADPPANSSQRIRDLVK